MSTATVPANVSGHYVYVLRCADDTLYTGYTTDVARRIDEHAAGEGAKYTRGRTPVELVHVEAFASRSRAMSREHAVKSLDRQEKEALLDRSGGDLPDAGVDLGDGADDRPVARGSHADDEGARTADEVGTVQVDDGGAMTGPVDHPPDREGDDPG